MAEQSPIAIDSLALEQTDASLPSGVTRQRLYAAILSLAEACNQRGLTQAAADILAFLMIQTDASEPVSFAAEAAFLELESRICPRIIYDAKDFAAGMDLLTMVEYLREILASEPSLALAQRQVASA